MGYQYAPAAAPVSRASSVAAPVSAGASVSLELNVHGTTAPREVADEAMGMIRFELAEAGGASWRLSILRGVHVPLSGV